MTLLITIAVIVFLLAVLVAVWLVTTANRLDRLHIRMDAAWAGLDAALARRAVVTRAAAAASCLPPDCCAKLRSCADAAERAARFEREAAESELSRMLSELDRSALPAPLAEELSDATQRVMLARRVHNDAVRDTKALRARRQVRWLRLAGTAPMPEYFEIAE